jgi:hypothetical protein
MTCTPTRCSKSRRDTFVRHARAACSCPWCSVDAQCRFFLAQLSDDGIEEFRVDSEDEADEVRLRGCGAPDAADAEPQPRRGRRGRPAAASAAAAAAFTTTATSACG